MSSSHLKPHYQILDIDENASFAQVKAAYLHLKTEFDNSEQDSNDFYFMEMVQLAYDEIRKFMSSIESEYEIVDKSEITDEKHENSFLVENGIILKIVLIYVH